MGELARCGSMVCAGPSRASSGSRGVAQSTGTEVQSMAPEELSSWCASLASCGVRGQALGRLQAVIAARSIDGKQFHDMLKNNALQGLAMQDLNPRLGVAIRRAWNADFGHIHFVAHYEPACPPAAAPKVAKPPLPRQWASARDSPGGRREEVGAELRQTRSAGNEQLRPASGSRRTQAASHSPANHAGYAETAEVLDSWMPAKPPAPTSYAPPQPVSLRRAPAASKSEGVSLDDIFAPRAKAPSSFAAPQPFNGRRAPAASNNQTDSLDDIFAPRAKAPISYAAPQPVGMRQAPAALNSDVGSLDDIFAPVGKAPISYAAPQPSSLRQAPAAPNHAAAPNSDIGSLDDVFAPAGKAPTSYAAPQPISMRQAPAAPNSDIGSLDDIFAPAGKAPTSYAAPQPASLRQAPAAPNSDVGSLDDIFAPAGKAPTSYAAPQPASLQQAPAAPNSDVASLDDIFAPAGKAPTSFAAPQPANLQQSPQHGPGNRAAATEAGGTLGDLLPPRQAQQNALPPDNRYASAPTNRRRQRHADEWNGVSLGDALQAKQPARNRYGADPTTADSATESAASAPPAARRADADSWGGASLGDALAPKKPARHRYGEAQAQERSPQAGEAPQLPKRNVDANFDGASLDDVLRPPQRSSEGQHGSVSHQPTNDHSPAAARGRHAAVSGPDPWAGVSLGDALQANPKPTVERASERESKNWSPRGANNSQAAGGTSGKTPTEIIEWLKTLPESHVPEQAREGIITCVESKNLDGDAFTKFVQKIDPEVCGPKPAMKLKAAWSNVLAEAAAREVCRHNLDVAANGPKKAVAIQIAC